MMRVVHVCSSDISGGAARAAYRLHKSFRSHCGVDSWMLVRGRATDDEKVVAYAPSFWSMRYHFNLAVCRRIQDVYWSKFVTSNRVMHSRADIWTGLSGALEELDCDLVHLHWLGSDTLSIEELGKIDKPVVWTLHDMWTFCGAEHYVSDEPDARFRIGYHNDNRPAGESGPDMNRKVWKRKLKAWTHPMNLVCPSSWMAECASTSVICRDWPVYHIPNPLDLKRWRPVPKHFARELFGVPHDKQVLLFGAIGGERDPRKGADLLRLALEALRDHGANVHLVVFGQSEWADAVPFAFPVTYLGRLYDEFSMIAAYSVADIMLVPSRQDNLPQTAVEAQACGVPVVAFDVGGLSDIVEHLHTGLLVPSFDIGAFTEAILRLLRDGGLRDRMALASQDAVLNKYSEAVVAAKYADLYSQLLSERSVE